MPIDGQTDIFIGDILARVKNEDIGTWPISFEATPCSQCRSRLTGNAEIGGKKFCWTCIAKIKRGK
jgi:hypothetical protein